MQFYNMTMHPQKVQILILENFVRGTPAFFQGFIGINVLVQPSKFNKI